MGFFRFVGANSAKDALSRIESIMDLRKNDPAKRISDLAFDPDTRQSRIAEATTAFKIEERFGYFGRYQRPSADAPKGDFQSLSGPYAGKTFDDFGSEISDGMIKQLQFKPTRTEKKFFESLELHLKEADYVILNLTKLKADAPALYQRTLSHVENHPMLHKVINVTE